MEFLAIIFGHYIGTPIILFIWVILNVAIHAVQDWHIWRVAKRHGLKLTKEKN